LADDLNLDLILMDIRLRGTIDGIEAAETIRREYAIRDRKNPDRLP
jgi:CheY-like chemotaxis protein